MCGMGSIASMSNRRCDTHVRDVRDAVLLFTLTPVVSTFSSSAVVRQMTSWAQ